MADMQETMQQALEALKGNARVEEADRISGSVRIIKRNQIRELVERFVKEFGTNAEMVEKLKAFEEELASQKSALEGTIASLREELEKAAADKATIEEKLRQLDAEKADLKRMLEESDVEGMSALRSSRDAALLEKETALEKLSKLEAIVASNNLQNRLKELEYLLINTRKAYDQALLGLEFVDVIEDVDYPKLIASAGLILDQIAEVGVKVTESQSPYYSFLQSRMVRIESQLKNDALEYSKLIDAMNADNGSVSVIVEIARIAVRAAGFKNELSLAGTAVGMIG
jgi:DNA repair exonuclease SbcCD ATPase subunit